MTVYIWIVAISVAMTIGTFFHHALLRNWYDVFLALPIWLGWFLAATALYFLLLYLISLTVDKSKPVRKKEPFFRWLLNQTVWLILHLGRVEIQCTGLEKLEGLSSFLLVANHLSNFDPFIAIATCPQADLAYIAKPEIFDIPITGRIVHKCFFCLSTGRITAKRWEPSSTLPSCCRRALCPSVFTRREPAARQENCCHSAMARSKLQNAQARLS